MAQLNLEASLPLRTQSQDWPSLIERLQAIALRTRSAKTETERRNFQTGQLLGKARAEFLEAKLSLRAANARLRETKEQADAALKAAEKRVNQAEERARAAEELLDNFRSLPQGEFFMITMSN
jgi:hypothetical protein